MAYAAAVAAVSTSNVTVSGPTSAIFDGITVATGQRVLLVNQNTGHENGVWIFNGSLTPMSRPASPDPFHGGLTLDYAIAVPVTGGPNGGLTWGGSEWWMNSPDATQAAAVVDTTATTFVRRNVRPVQARLASTSSITISSPGSSIDGVTPNTGDVVLLLGQSPNTANGLYVYNTSSTAMVRTADPIYPNMEVLVNEGSTNLHTRWKLVTQAAGNIVIGTTALTFSRQSLVINVRDFGATGNGTTDDTNAIKAAISAFQAAAQASPATAPQLYFPPGNYLVNDMLVVANVKGAVIAGAGEAQSIIQAGTGGTGGPGLQGQAAILRLTNCTNVTTRDLAIYGTAYQTTLTNNANAGDTILHVTAGTGTSFSANQVVVVSVVRTTSPDNSAFVYFELATVATGGANTVTLASGLANSYVAGSPPPAVVTVSVSPVACWESYNDATAAGFPGTANRVERVTVGSSALYCCLDGFATNCKGGSGSSSMVAGCLKVAACTNIQIRKNRPKASESTSMARNTSRCAPSRRSRSASMAKASRSSCPRTLALSLVPSRYWRMASSMMSRSLRPFRARYSLSRCRTSRLSLG
jgi:hypothetical protein